MNEIKRKFFEVWGDLEAQNNTLKLVCFTLIGLLLFSLLMSYLSFRRPPAVIRVTEIGKAEAVKDYPSESSVTKPELVYFTTLFINQYTGYNSYTIATELPEAFSLMTAGYQKIAKREVIDSSLITKISAAGINTIISIREVKVEREDKNYAVLSFLGLRTITSYQNRDFKEESLFKGDIILKKIPRTMANAHGLLVEEYREVLIKQLEK